MAFRSPTVRFAVGLLGLVALTSLVVTPVLSQAPPPSQLLQLNVVSIKPDSLPAYIELQKSEIIPALQKAGVPWRETWRTATFGETFMFGHVTPIASFERYDGQSPILKALGEAGYATLMAKLRPMIVTQKMYALRTRPDLSVRTEGMPSQKMAILTMVNVSPTKLQEFETFIKAEWIPALKKGGGKSYSVVQVLYGGGTTEFHTLVGIDKYADLASHPVIRAIGEDGLTKMMAKSGGFATSIERSVIRLDPDLSFELKTPSSQ